jgi:CRP/FNR family transcriptional regulator, nitrogen oxide reductase regulator
VQSSEALAWDGAEMTSLMLRFPSVAINAARLVAQRLHDLQRQHREVMTERADRRIARALLRLLRHTGQAIGGGLEIAFPLSQHELAQMAGTTVFTVSRTLGHWESEGVLERGRRKVVIRQPETLLRIAGESPD